MKVFVSKEKKTGKITYKEKKKSFPLFFTIKENPVGWDPCTARQVFHVQLMKLACTSLAEKQVWDRFDDFVNALMPPRKPFTEMRLSPNSTRVY